MTHIILLDGKLWAFEPPEKPDYCSEYPSKGKCESPCLCGMVNEAYDRAYSLALEQKLEVDRRSFTDSCRISKDGQYQSMSFKVDGIRCHLDVNEPIKWEGGFTIINACQSDVCTEDGRCEHCRDPKKLIRLIAPVKEEKTVRVCQHCGQAIKWEIKFKDEPVPSEQENQEELMTEIKSAIKTTVKQMYDNVPSVQSNAYNLWLEIRNRLERIKELISPVNNN